jgi:VWFA-related protein
MLKIPYIVGLWAAILAVWVGSGVGAPQAQAPAASGGVVKTASEEVLLDVVVRDKKGHAVKDLKPDDFHVFDNGEPKKITAFHLIEGKEAIGADGARTPLDRLHQVRLVTMIFQFRSAARRMGQEEAVGADHGSTIAAPTTNRGNALPASDADAKRLARSGALDFLKLDLPPNVYMAVMTIDHQLEVLQPYTNDRDLLRQAIEQATKLQVTDFAADTERVRQELTRAAGSSPQAAPAPTNPPSGQPAVPSHAMDTDGQAKPVMTQMLLQTLNAEQSNAMTVPGRLEIFALLDAVKQQYRLPGRKSVLYFSEGFTIPQGLEAAFDDLIGSANRSNVSLYIVDAHGLASLNPNQSSRDELSSAAQTDRDQAGKVGNEPVSLGEARLMDTVVQSTRSNYQLTLAHLANSTGGFLIANTNDLRGPLRRLAEDIQEYYEVSYAPEIRNYDGSFHKVAVKLSSGDLRVQSRSGYNALPLSMSSGATALLPYEVPLMAALNSPEVPKAFDYESAGLYFRGLKAQPECEVVVDVPLSNVTFQKGDVADQFKGSLSYVVLVKDAQGQVVKKLENEVPILAQSARLEALKANHFIYTENFDLPPGRYDLESAVRDGGGNRTSVSKSSVLIAPLSGLAISGVSVIRSTKERGASTADSDPFLLGTKVISPTLNPVINKATNSTLPFYLVIYPDKNVTEPAQLVMEFSRDGKVLGKGLPPLSAPDKDGRIQYVAMTPLEHFEPGNFTVRFIVKQGSETAEETASFVLK